MRHLNKTEIANKLNGSLTNVRTSSVITTATHHYLMVWTDRFSMKQGFCPSAYMECDWSGSGHNEFARALADIQNGAKGCRILLVEPKSELPDGESRSVKHIKRFYLDMDTSGAVWTVGARHDI